ncbi:2OG-Fe dioxygenase family protein [Neptunomonas sp.]|uniref:2OG-Fe dioxygenase family protein n=1 Tax=Neptunomonas sp. TaxID=1971898 RepID=UPI0025F70D53|nr:2OG-Fe dioxygenase family protein [Neptunomonas sp.]
MKSSNISFLQPTLPPLIHGGIPYWESSVRQDLSQGSWSKANIEEHIDLEEWQDYLKYLPKDPYVDTRWKRMSWLFLDDDNQLQIINECPMAQGSQYNDAATMADKLRYYPQLQQQFLKRQDVQVFIKNWASLWNIGPHEPILMQINGVRGQQLLDPLQGQGIHQDGSQFLSILVLNRSNVAGGSNALYKDKTGKHPLTEVTLEPGEILHVRDNEVFHNVSQVHPISSDIPFERFIIIINSRFNDKFQNKVLQEHYPNAVLNNV